MSRTVALNALKQGITRLRDKGGADPKSLYDLENGYVTLSGTIQSRPGTVEDAVLPEGTKGLCAFNGAMVVFSHVVTPGMPAGYSCEVLTHPTEPSLAISEIHFAAPFLGFLYVVPEFTNGDIFHYWLQGTDEAEGTWAAETIYDLYQVVKPTVPNGLAYRATRLNPADPVWGPSEARVVGDVVEPSTWNKFKYTVTTTVGTNPKSGTVEPTWTAEDGAIVIEQVDLTPPDPPGGPTGPGGGSDGDPLPGDIEDRYCVAVDMRMAGGGLAGQVSVGDLHDCHAPGEGFMVHECIGAGVSVLQPCVRLLTDGGAALVCSRTTPFTLVGGGDESLLAPDMLDHSVYVLRDGHRAAEVVVSVEDAGERMVALLDFGGRSFAAGEGSALIYSHNLRKQF